MNPINIDKLNNNIKLITRQNPNTPRTAINLFMNTGVMTEAKAGTASLVGKLLLQGTAARTAEDIANEIDSNALEISVDSKQDYVRIRALSLNEDFGKAIDLLDDILKNSTFENLEKERRKLEGELTLDLDSPKTQAFDKLIRSIYKDHPYGNTHTKILEDLNSISVEDIKNFYTENSFKSDKLAISVVGDINRENILQLINDKFGNIPNSSESPISLSVPQIEESQTVKLTRNDSSQAQIVQGWRAPKVNEEDFVTVSLLNTILGASGLSSRLFVELRDKKGLAYVVRSGYEALKQAGLFTVYIGTAPQNISVSLEGFNVEIKKLQDELVSEKELNDAKNNYLGKRAFFHETNSQQAYYLGLYETIGLGPQFDEEIRDRIRKITSEQIREAANKYFSQNSITSILAPEENLVGV